MLNAWDLSGDELVVDLREAVHDVEVLTKRRIVSIVSRIFDPIGIVSPVTIQAKLLLQQLHKAKIEWDSSIEGELMCCWNTLHLYVKVSLCVCLDGMREIGKSVTMQASGCVVSVMHQLKPMQQLCILCDALMERRDLF